VIGRVLAAGAAALLAGPGCVTERDLDVFVLLPARCADLGAARVAIDVTTADGEAFSIAGDACSDRLAGQEVSGFATLIPQLGPGYHRADLVVENAEGGALGGRSRPFPGDEALVMALGRADLPGWPTAALEVTIPACVAGAGVPALRLTATAPTAVNPEVDQTIACDGGAPATASLVLPRGPSTIVAEATCWRGAAEAVVDGGAIELALARSCP
jgi:hypothetical protein